MGILDDPGRFYAPPQTDWALGDLVIVPSGVLRPVAGRRMTPFLSPAPLPDGTVGVFYPLWQPSDPLAQPGIEAILSPALIVADDCVLDKEFNAYVERRIQEGVASAVAEDEARNNDTLDQIVPVAPILPYAALTFTNPEAVRTAQAIGFFPIVAAPDQVDEGYVDLTRILPVSRKLLWGPAAALSEPARRILRWKLAQFLAYRNLSVDAEISAAVGKTITNVHVVADQKDRLVVDLELDHGNGQLRLRQEPRRPDLPAGHSPGRSPSGRT